ncbi:MAG: glutamine--tRNA ligase/YqeY domain fusion protein [Prolixibacteraceae bacterium]|nr:glutamine--tRNA ligase/YqeY domain fusion protein [Prolixibacteraceae bacterium]MBT6006236.1 glutamine--tRNA ligase/YqeY domain fusion protein [Prolixibacteraceae bacterium]MBT6997209.1 glutamine--tRNA ligase/YqeY domain fusion protein [Prolixibacteraceae bacterium]MBT7395141.1 glutamine--tRNA ligase/YqeY domain fusion protein [Prolixibacteraceae bacterium]
MANNNGGSKEMQLKSNFIHLQIDEDLKLGKNNNRVHTRFPPEPNGYLHIGHAKSICLNFGIANKFGGKCNLRFDDTNPSKEETEYVESIMEDIHWLGFDWEDRLFYASDYFEKLHEFAIQLIRNGKAYVDDQDAETISSQKGTPTRSGIESPFRNRSAEENLDLFNRMTAGEFDEGSYVLRAKIDMSSPNMHMRDPIIYRIMKAHHHRTGNKWVVYPMYDFAHGQSDFWEGITHSICTLEFEVHRPLYDWFVDQLQETEYRPRQIEFARLNLTYTVMSKRKLLELVKDGHVKGWDDPRMPTVSGLRRRGFTPESIRNFADRIGVTKVDGMIDVSLLEYSVREHLNKTAQRVMGVLNPLKVVITNYPEDKTEELDAINNPEDLEMGTRKVPFSREIYIERDDFMEDPPRKFFRLGPGREVRLRYAYFVTCTDVIKNNEGEITELHCTHDPASKGGNSPDGRKVKATLHWVSAKHAIKSEVRLYDRLFNDENPDGHKDVDFKEFMNPESLKILPDCYLEPFIKNAKPLDHFQFERLGYFNLDSDSAKEKPVFNRTVPLRDSWAKAQKK